MKNVFGRAVATFFLTALLTSPSVNATEIFDVNGDSKTGLYESIYALQIASGILHKTSDPFLFTGSGTDCINGTLYEYELDFQTHGNFVFGNISMGKQGKPLENYQLYNGTLLDNILSFRVVDIESAVYQFAMVWKDNELKGGITKLKYDIAGFGVTELISIELK